MRAVSFAGDGPLYDGCVSARGAQIVEPIENPDAIGAVINDAALAYRGVIPADRWHEPYMPHDELVSEMRSGVKFFCLRRDGRVAGVMGLQSVADVALIRHAYTLSSQQHSGVGSLLLDHVRRQTDRPLLVGTWKAASWAVHFYERRGFRLVPEQEKAALLRQYWTVSERQIEESVVLRE
jgi:N-acetylglutamate synthase-like GNAT family acetyltransferase